MPTAEAPAAPLIDLNVIWTDGRYPPMDHLAWARWIAGKIAAKNGFRRPTSEADDIEAVALLTLWRKALAFDAGRVPPGGDPHGQFRGWAHVSIREECEAEARSLRGGGTFYRADAERVAHVRIDGLPVRVSDHGEEEVMIYDYRQPDPPEDESESF